MKEEPFLKIVCWDISDAQAMEHEEQDEDTMPKRGKFSQGTTSNSAKRPKPEAKDGTIVVDPNAEK
ncbi:hypothetical protein RvY_00559 [Ramazzottius varieornatus]|uniref:Uncharacterized protein n=1 Tax=Ramazzottius varieornatus TaxID=947166 RepID=A0A1D1UKG3_RAMVA|nr:hypothetical protein RvY_00559 [Ramazzottius varieornatus]